MLIVLLWLGLALAQDAEEAPPPTCSTTELAALPEPPGRLAVAWVAPWHRRPHGSIRVVPTSELTGWLATQKPRWTGRTLQWLGLRRRNTDPRRRFQVRIFEVDASDLCRPVDGVEKDVSVSGIPACAPRRNGPDRQSDGCGHALDRRTGEPGPTRYVVKARDAREAGYCVVPLRRYVDEVGRKKGK